MSVNSKRKLKAKDAQRFRDAEPSLFRELAVVICECGVLPEKELHECWQMALAVHKAFPKALHFADLAAGHGLLSWILVLLARSGEDALPRTTVAVDITRPKSAKILAKSLKARWPELEESVHYVEGSIDAVFAENGPDTVFVAIHACGSLSDRVLMAAIASQSPLVVMPCCHSLSGQMPALSMLGLASGLDPSKIEGQATAIDQFRIDVLSEFGYQIREDSIDADITLCNRMIVAKVPPQGLKPMRRDFDRKESQVKRMGEVRAYETVRLFDLSDFEMAKTLSLRPSREWKRVFDLSFWIDDETSNLRLLSDLKALAEAGTFKTSIWEHSRYVDPLTKDLSVTYRFEMKSSDLAISKEVGLSLRRDICSAVSDKYRLRT